MAKAIYGYIRVSSIDQNESRQILAMEPYKIKGTNIYIDKKSGKNFERSEYKKLLKRIKSDDVLVIKSIDRLGRNYEEVLEQWRIITKIKGADIIVIDMPLLDTTMSKDLLGTFISDLVLQLLSFIAQNERESIRQRQAEGIVAARKRGTKFGRPTKELPENFEELFRKWNQEGLTRKEMAVRCNMHVSAFYRKVKGKYVNL
ncbi:MAG: recombinase family protein [Lachnospiraceae bacterium]|nr:recombinase family protein [Lachnospiraceae bacterium]